MGKVNVIYDDLYSSANNLEGVIDYLNQAKGQLEFISTAIGIINRNHDCFSKTEQGIADLKREFANYITEVTFLQNQCRNAANAFKDVEGKNVKATDSMLAVINDATTMLGQDKITDPDITAYNKRKDFEESKEHWDEATATDRSKTWNNTFVENDDKMVSINSALSTQAESVIDPEKEEEEEKVSEEPLKDEQESQHGSDHGNDEEPVYNPPKGTAPSEEKPEGNKQGKTDLGTKKSDSTEDKKDDPLKETKTKTESGKETDQGTKKEDEPSTVTPPSDTQTETTTTTTTPTKPQQETYVPPAETNNNNNWQPSNNNNNYNNYSNETPINNDVETGEETMTTEPEILEGSDETAPSSEMPDDEIVKGNEYTKIPTSDTPIETKHKSGNSFIPIAAGLSAAAAAGIGAKAYMDRKNNNDNGEDDFTSEEWDGDESTISDYNTGNKVEIQEDTLEEDPINDNVEPEKYGARNNEELVDIQQ